MPVNVVLDISWRIPAVEQFGYSRESVAQLMMPKKSFFPAQGVFLAPGLLSACLIAVIIAAFIIARLQTHCQLSVRSSRGNSRCLRA
jgi:hypothetical protein